MDELVSIIMPSYNTGRFISETIESVLAQSYSKWELIIVDDCSTDNTDDVVNPYLDDTRIHYIKNDTNSGAAVSRNRALREAKGKWIAFLDSDDLWESDKLKKQVAFMKDNNYHFSYTNYISIVLILHDVFRIRNIPKVIMKPMMFLDSISYEGYLVHHFFILGTFSLLTIIDLQIVAVITIFVVTLICGFTVKIISQQLKKLIK